MKGRGCLLCVRLVIIGSRDIKDAWLLQGQGISPSSSSPMDVFTVFRGFCS